MSRLSPSSSLDEADEVLVPPSLSLLECVAGSMLLLGIVLCFALFKERLIKELRWVKQLRVPHALSARPAAVEASKSSTLDAALSAEIIKLARAEPVDPANLQVKRRLGRGTQGDVWLGYDQSSGRHIALKQLRKSRLAARIPKGARLARPERTSWMTERNALLACGDHPFITTLHAAFQDDDALFLALELGSAGDLFCRLHATEEGRLAEPQARFYTACIGLALSHIHSNGFLYCDVKLENVVIAPNGYPRLCDFGLVHQLQGTSKQAEASSEAQPAAVERVTRKCGTDQYQPPEVVEGYGRTASADWWAVGVMLHEMLAGRSPFDDGAAETGKQEIYERIRSYAKGGRDAAFDLITELLHEDEVTLTPSGGDLLLGLLDANEDERLGCGINGFTEIEGHEWFSSLDWIGLVKQQLTPPWLPREDYVVFLEHNKHSDIGTKEVREAEYDSELWPTAFDLFGPYRTSRIILPAEEGPSRRPLGITTESEHDDFAIRPPTPSTKMDEFIRRIAPPPLSAEAMGSVPFPTDVEEAKANKPLSPRLMQFLDEDDDETPRSVMSSVYPGGAPAAANTCICRNAPYPVRSV